jgi:serine/threonine protein kinase
LGEGGFGKVYRGTHKKTREVVAIKTIDISEYYKSADKIDQIYREAKIIKQLSHRNIIKLYQAFEIRKELNLIMEYAGGGELSDFVKELGGLTEIETRNIIR